MKNDNISVEYVGNSENNMHTICRINGKNIYIPKRHKAFTSCAVLYEDCKNIKAILENRGDILPFIEKYGGTCGYEIMEAVDCDAVMAYFRDIAERKIQNREPVYPRKIMKAYKLNNVVDKNSDNAVIAMLEEYAKKLKDIYPEINNSEIEKKDAWRLYYIQQNTLRYVNIDFSCFGDGKLRDEILSFLRAYYEFSTCTSLYRLYKDLRIAFGIMGADKSVLELSSAHAMKLRLELNLQKHFSVSCIAEIINYTGNFFEYTAFCADAELNNPFDRIKVKDKHYYQSHTEPVQESTLKILNKAYMQMPICCQIAYLILIETGVRANEACCITLDELELDDIENPVLNVILRKNGKARIRSGQTPRVKHRISFELAEILKKYVEVSKGLREQINSSAVLIYMPATYRKGSKRLPVELKSHTLEYWMKKVCIADGEKSGCTPRQIRAEVGRRLFSAGCTPSEVANTLGNTPGIANMHYNTMTPEDEASLYSKLYSETIINPESVHLVEGLSESCGPHSELYGKCNAEDSSSCKNKNRCEKCSSLIKMR